MLRYLLAVSLFTHFSCKDKQPKAVEKLRVQKQKQPKQTNKNRNPATTAANINNVAQCLKSLKLSLCFMCPLKPLISFSVSHCRLHYWHKVKTPNFLHVLSLVFPLEAESVRTNGSKWWTFAVARHSCRHNAITHC